MLLLRDKLESNEESRRGGVGWGGGGLNQVILLRERTTELLNKIAVSREPITRADTQAYSQGQRDREK